MNAKKCKALRTVYRHNVAIPSDLNGDGPWQIVKNIAIALREGARYKSMAAHGWKPKSLTESLMSGVAQ